MKNLIKISIIFMSLLVMLSIPVFAEEAETAVEEQASIKAKNVLKVYNMPLITSTVVNEIAEGAELNIIKEITNWSYVSAGDIQGWVRTYGIDGNVIPQVPEEIPEEIPEQKPEQEPEETPEDIVEEEETPEVTNPVESEDEEDDDTEYNPSNSEQTESSVTAKKGFVDVDNANVRKKPTTDSEIVTTLCEGTSFTINAETEEWYKITYTGIDGTVYEGYIYRPLVKI